jgi:hypothetical protein
MPKSWFILAGMVCGLASPSRVWGHPLLQNSWWVVVESNRLTMRVSATLREVVVAQQLAPGLANASSRGFDADQLWRAVNQHTNYLLAHLHVAVDGRELRGRVLHTTFSM